MASQIIKRYNLNTICQICKGYWIHNDPRILTCQHTFCFQCIKSIVTLNSQLICPICSETFHISKRYLSKLKKNNHFDELAKINENENTTICSIHKNLPTHYCKTHSVETVCNECLKSKHRECEIITLEDYRILRESIEIIMETINKKQESIKRDVDDEETNTLEEFKRIREVMNKSFNNLIYDLNYTIKNNYLDEENAKNLEKIIKRHTFAELPNAKNIGVSFSLDFKSVLKFLSELLTSNNMKSFMELTTSLNLPFKQLSNIDALKFKMELFSSQTKTLFSIQLKNDNSNSFDVFIIERYVLSKNDYKNLTIILQKFKVESFCLRRNTTMSNGFSNILYTLKNSFDTLIDISIVDCNLNENQAINLGKLFSNCERLETINISLNNNMKDGFVNLCKGLRKSVNCLKRLNFSYCDLNEEQCSVFGNLLTLCTKIEAIDISHNGNTCNGLSYVIKSLEKSSKCLKDINFSYCDLITSQCADLCELLGKCRILETINLESNCNMGRGIGYVFEGLQRSVKTLKNLYLGNCDLARQQLKDLGKFLSKCSSINIINLSKSQNAIEEFPEVCTGLRKSSKTLVDIDLSGHNVGDGDKTALESLLVECSNIERLVLDLTEIRQEFLNMSECLKNSVNSLKEIELKCYILDQNDFKNIQRCLRYCKNLEIFNLCYLNPMIFQSSLDFYKSFYGSRNTLKSLQLGFPLNNECCESLSKLLKNCTNIEAVSFPLYESNKSITKNLSNALKNFYSTLKNFNLTMTESMDEYDEFIELIRNCNKLEVISLPWHKSLKSALLNSASSLKEISFQGELDEECCKDIGELFKNCTNIEYINLSEIQKTKNGLLNIYKGLIKSSNTIKGLILDIANVNDDQISKIMELWKNCSNFTKRNISLYFLRKGPISVYHNFLYCKPIIQRIFNFLLLDLNEDQCKIIGDSMHHISQIDNVNLAENRNMGDGCINIFQGLINSYLSLRVLNLYNANLKENHCIELSKLLENCKIEFLDIGRNRNMLDGPIYILRSLMNSKKTLKVLNIGKSGNFNANIKESLCKFLKSCTKLEEIDLAEINFTDYEINHLCDSLKSLSNTLSSIDFSDCNLTDAQGFLLSQIFFGFKTLKRFNLQGNLNMGHGVFILCGSLSRLNYSLRKIELDSQTTEQIEKFTKG